MSEKTGYTITRTEISLSGGVKVVADVSTAAGITELLRDLKAAGFGEPIADSNNEAMVAERRKRIDDLEDPARRVEMQAGLDAGRLAGAKILAVKDGIPQLLQKSIFPTVTDAILVLMYTLEVGLKQNPVGYEEFAALFESQNLKAGSPLSMLVTNLRNAGYLDKRAYSDGRKLRLAAKGESKAVEVLKKLATR